MVSRSAEGTPLRRNTCKMYKRFELFFFTIKSMLSSHFEKLFIQSKSNNLERRHRNKKVFTRRRLPPPLLHFLRLSSLPTDGKYQYLIGWMTASLCSEIQRSTYFKGHQWLGFSSKSLVITRNRICPSSLLDSTVGRQPLQYST